MIRQLLPVFALLLSTLLLLAGGGVQWVLMPVRSQLEGFSTDAVGLIGVGWAIGFTSGCMLAAGLVRRVGHVRCFASLLALLGISVLASALMIDARAWFVLRVLSGFCFAGSYMIIESWMNERVTNENRGAIFSVYLVATQLGIIAGQYVIVFAPPSTSAPFMVAAILFALAILPTALSTAPSPAPIAATRPDFASLYRNSPAALVGVLLSGAIAGAWQNFAPYYGSLSGLSNANIANMLALAMVGAAASQFPFGKLSDRVDRRHVLIGIGITGAVLCTFIAFFPVDSDDPGILFFTLMVLAGTAIYPAYGVMSAHANDHANPGDYVRVSSGLLMAYGIGGIIGPPIAARATEATGAGGVFLTMAAMNLILALHTGWRLTQRRPPSDADAVPFRAMTPATVQTPQTVVLAPNAEASGGDSDDSASKLQ